MGTYSFKATMPMALHPNTYLDVIWEGEKVEDLFGLATTFSFDLDHLLYGKKGIASRIPLFDYSKKSLEGKLTEVAVGPVSDGKLQRYPVRWKKPQHRVVMNRNTTYWLTQYQKAKDDKNSMGGIISYKQPKRGVVMAMFHLYESLVLLQRASTKDGHALPKGFEFKHKDKLTIDDIKSRVIGDDFETNFKFPVVRDFTKSYDVKGSSTNNRNLRKGWYGLELENGTFMAKHKQILCSMVIKPTKEASAEIEALTKLKPIVKKPFPYNVIALLKHHKFAYYRMINDGCKDCNVESGEPCKLEKLGATKKILKDYNEINYSNQTISRLYTGGSAGSDDQRGRRKELKDFLHYYYSFCNIFNAPVEKDGFISKEEEKEIWKDWDHEHRSHAVEAVGKRGPLLVPFACEQRLKISNYTTTFSKILQAGIFPLILRKESTPNKGSPNRFFGGVNPPSLTVQNLWVDLMKRVLSSKQSKDKDRLGIDSVKSSLRILWECLGNEPIETVELDKPDQSKGKQIQYLRLAGKLDNLRLEVKNDSDSWNWNDYRNWEEGQGKLPIVSMNTSIEEISQLFTEYDELPGLIIAIDQWHIKGDEDKEYDYSTIDDDYHINETRFSPEERTGARTFATFLKRIIDTANYGILSSEVIHTRRAYGVLLRGDFKINGE